MSKSGCRAAVRRSVTRRKALHSRSSKAGRRCRGWVCAWARGNGSCLLVCAGPEQSATPLASDLARVLGATPVWAWPSEDPDSGALAQAVDDRLFTSVVVFGAGLAARVCGGEPPASCGSAQLLVGPDLEELLTQADARRQCWAVLRAGGLQLGK